ncbi:MAG: DNA translocase FtsK [Patescibacteria group bacterium]
MNNTKKAIESLKTEIAGLKIRTRRIEDYLLGIPNPEEYIHESDSEEYIDEFDSDGHLLEEAKKIVVNYDRASISLLQRNFSIGYARAKRLLDELEKIGVVGHAEGSIPREVLKNNQLTAKKKLKK